MPLLWTKRKRPAGRGEIYAPVYARGSLRGSLSLSLLSLCFFVWQILLWMNNQMQRRDAKSHCVYKTWGVAIKDWESETEQKRKWQKWQKWRKWNVYLFRLNGEGISVHESYECRVPMHTHTHARTHVYSQCLSMWLIHCAASMHFLFLRCCNGDLQPLKLIMQMSYLSPLPSNRGRTFPLVTGNV